MFTETDPTQSAPNHSGLWGTGVLLLRIPDFQQKESTFPETDQPPPAFLQNWFLELKKKNKSQNDYGTKSRISHKSLDSVFLSHIVEK